MSDVLGLYDRALPQVYGYLVRRCGDAVVAEDLTAETFLAAVDATNRGSVASLTVPWLIGVARNKLVDHWRRQEREDRTAQRAYQDGVITDVPWDVPADVQRARETLARLRGPHRAVLTLRYMDGLSVPEIADVFGRTVHATEGLVTRARAAFRRVYEEEAEHDA